MKRGVRGEGGIEGDDFMVDGIATFGGVIREDKGELKGLKTGIFRGRICTDDLMTR